MLAPIWRRVTSIGTIRALLDILQGVLVSVCFVVMDNCCVLIISGFLLALNTTMEGFTPRQSTPSQARTAETQELQQVFQPKRDCTRVSSLLNPSGGRFVSLHATVAVFAQPACQRHEQLSVKMASLSAAQHHSAQKNEEVPGGTRPDRLFAVTP